MSANILENQRIEHNEKNFKNACGTPNLMKDDKRLEDRKIKK